MRTVISSGEGTAGNPGIVPGNGRPGDTL